jgi:hypothetical protein
MLDLVLKWLTAAFGPPLMYLSLNLALWFVNDFILHHEELATSILAQKQVLHISRGKMCFGLYLEIYACKKCKLS